MAWHRLQASGDRVEALGQRRMVAHEQQEEAVTDGVERQRAAFPDPQLVAFEDRSTDVVELEVAFEADAP